MPDGSNPKSSLSITFTVLALVLLVAVIFLGYWIFQKRNSLKVFQDLPEDAFVNMNINENASQGGDGSLGGDRDEHGCIGSAGYSWCAAKQKCLRPWEEKCE